MRPYRVSIAGLTALVLFAALGLSALRRPSPLWASGLFTTAVGLLCWSLVRGICERGRRRAFWLGFSTFGWAYLVMTFGPWPNPNGAETPPFLTTALLDAIKPSDPAPQTYYMYKDDPMSLTEQPRAMTASVGSDVVILDTGHYRPDTSSSSVISMITMPGTPRFQGRVVNLVHYRRIGHSLGAVLFGLIGAILCGWPRPSDEPGPTSPV